MHVHLGSVDFKTHNLKCVAGIFGIIGILFNTINLLLLCRIRFKSLVTNALFRTLTGAGCTTCLLILLYSLLPGQPRTGSDWLNQILCHIWFREYLFWTSNVVSLMVVVCISTDRLVAVVWPVYYRSHQGLLKLLCLIFICVYTLFLCLPNTFRRSYEHGMCHLDSIQLPKVIQKVFTLKLGCVWVVFTYAIPGVFMVVAHVVIFFVVWSRCQHNCCNAFITDAPAVNDDPNESANSADSQPSSRKLGSNLKRLILNTTLLSTNVLLQTIPPFIAMLDGFNVIGFTEYTQQIAICLVTLSACCNPILMVTGTQCLRQFVLQTFKGYLQAVKKQ